MSPNDGEVITIDRNTSDYFVFIYRPGPAWVEGKSVRKQPVVAHATYMGKLERKGRLLMGGPFKDDSGAFGILQCESIEAARKLIESDPAIRDQLMVAEVHPWFPAVSGCLDSRPW